MKEINFKKQPNMKFETSSYVLILFLFLFLIMGFIFSGCTTDSIVDNNSSDNLSLSVKANNQIDNPANTLTISSAKFLVKEIEFETEGSSNSHKFKIGPYVVNLNMSGTLIEIINGTIPSGKYEKIKFKIHKPEDNEPIPDPEFREGTSGQQRYSVIAKGTFNGVNFVYKSRESINMKLTFQNLINITSTSAFNVTAIVNPYKWFSFNSNYIDPSNPNNTNIIDDNIKNSFENIFEDNDKDGNPDS